MVGRRGFSAACPTLRFLQPQSVDSGEKQCCATAVGIDVLTSISDAATNDERRSGFPVAWPHPGREKFPPAERRDNSRLIRRQALQCRLDILVRPRFDGQECPSYGEYIR